MTHSPGAPVAPAPPQRRLLPSCFLAASLSPAGWLCSCPLPCAALLLPFLSLCEHPLPCCMGSGPRCPRGVSSEWVSEAVHLRCAAWGATTLSPLGAGGDWLGVTRAGDWRSGDSGIRGGRFHVHTVLPLLGWGTIGFLFIGVKFTQQNINHLEVNHSVAFRTFTRLSTHPYL